MGTFAVVRGLQLSPNALLAALPPDEYERIGPDLTTVEVKLGEVLHVRDEPIRDVYFPHQGVYSMIMTMADGQRVESACIGSEGMLGIHAFLGEAPTPNDTLLQVGDGIATKMRLAAFRREIQRRGMLHQLVSRYAQALLAAMMQTSACNRLHPLRQRCSRWLLETHDRIHRDEFQLSHEFLAVMLGVYASDGVGHRRRTSEGGIDPLPTWPHHGDRSGGTRERVMRMLRDDPWILRSVSEGG